MESNAIMEGEGEEKSVAAIVSQRFIAQRLTCAHIQMVRAPLNYY